MKLTELRSKIAAEVRASIARAGRSVRDISDSSDISPASMSRKLRGEVSFSVEELIAIANTLDVPVATFLPSDEHAAA